MTFKHFLISILFFYALQLHAQFSIEGTLEPEDKKLTWAMLYQIKEGRQHYIKNTKIKDQRFKFELNDTAEVGMYRVVYRLKDEGFVDFLFNKENVVFTFNPDYAEVTTVYQTSIENKNYQSYLNEITSAQQVVDSLQVAYFRNTDSASKSLYKDAISTLNNVQEKHEDLNKDKLALHFIKATKRYNAPEIVPVPQIYLKNIKANFFQHINFQDEVLIGSSFLVDRVIDYVFYINTSKNTKMQQSLYKEALENVFSIEKSDSLQKDLIEILIDEFVVLENIELVNYLLDEHYARLPIDLQKSAYPKETRAKLKVVVGAIAPEIVWEEENTTKKLSELNTHKNYVVVFWSTGCSHCKKQMPEMYQLISTKKDIQVIAVALEKNAKEWKKVIPNFEGWHHVLGEKKWENETARSYDVTGTPTYFVLDANKVILAKPENFRDLEKALRKL